MINLVLYAVLGFVGLKIYKGQTSTAASATSASRTAATAGALAQNKVTNGSGGKTAASQSGNVYEGAALGAVALAAPTILKGLASLAQQSKPTATDEPDVDDSDLESATQEMAASSQSATDDNEVAGDTGEGDEIEEDA